LKKIVIKAPRTGFDSPYVVMCVSALCTNLLTFRPQNPRRNGVRVYDIR
jgi:hypothetical protein